MNELFNLRQFVNQHKTYTFFIILVLAAICSALVEREILANHLGQGTLFDAGRMGSIITVPFSQLVTTWILSLVFFLHVRIFIEEVRYNDVVMQLIVPFVLLFFVFNWRFVFILRCFG